MNEQQPATKQDLAELEARLTAAVRDMLHETEQRLEAYARQAAEDTETRILTAIHGYAERAELRLHRLETAEASTTERVRQLEAGALWADLQRRIVELEKRLPPGPPQH